MHCRDGQEVKHFIGQAIANGWWIGGDGLRKILNDISWLVVDEGATCDKLLPATMTIKIDQVTDACDLRMWYEHTLSNDIEVTGPSISIKQH